jgi:hypothetical protein
LSLGDSLMQRRDTERVLLVAAIVGGRAAMIARQFADNATGIANDQATVAKR